MIRLTGVEKRDIEATRSSMARLRFQDPAIEQAFSDQLNRISKGVNRFDRLISVLLLIVCAGMTAVNTPSAVLLLTLWLYSRPGLKFVDALMISLLTLYGYIVYMVMVKPGCPFWSELVLLVMVNMLCVSMRHLFEQSIRVFFFTNHALKRVAALDELTNAYNRRHIYELGRKTFDRCIRHQSELAVMMLDIDHFKKINDRYGHAAGDRTLTDLTFILQKELRSQDFFGRYGGDEFLVLLPDTSLYAARETADRIQKILRNHKITYEKNRLEYRISIGIASIAEQTRQFDELVQQADMALYRAKVSGRNQIKSTYPGSGIKETGMQVQH
ncbi:MAG: GGDEF domain-containing protein [Gammaproteobacteria bacterium]